MSEDFVAPEAPVASNVVSADEIQIPTTAPSKVAGQGGGGSRIQIKTPAGQIVDRNAYIRKLASAKWTRGQITEHLKKECGDTSIRYQTVYQATKDLYPAKAKSTGGVAQSAPQAPVVEEQPVDL